MKIVFITSILGKATYRDRYNKIIKILGKTEHKIISDHIANVEQADIDSWDSAKQVKFHKETINQIKNTDIVIAEISYPSFSVGYLISLAINEFYKPVIVLYSGDKKPNLLSILESQNKAQILLYDNVDNLSRDLIQEINYAKDQIDVRFNFFIPPKIVYYLDWISKRKKIPRAVYLRRLIEGDIDKNKMFKAE